MNETGKKNPRKEIDEKVEGKIQQDNEKLKNQQKEKQKQQKKKYYKLN